MTRFAVLALLAVGAAPQDAPKPNILWITCEDISPNLGCYGDAYAVTPNLDRLASQGVRYTRAFAPIGVCAPSRSSLIMGVYAPSVGSHPMRSRADLPEAVKCFPEYLRQAGYYCTNNSKTDYNFPVPRGAWDANDGKAHWKGRKPGQPFFSVFNLTSCHESQIRISENAWKQRVAKFAPGEVHDPAKAPVPPYHPDTPEVRRDWARYADAITFMDKEAGKILEELEAEGLAGDTIVIYFSDHGAGMPRHKRWLYDSSLRVPMIVRVPEKYKAWAPGAPGTTSDRLVTFVDCGPTVLNLAGVKVPSHMQGRAFLGPDLPPAREYVHGFRDRMDERVDMLRCVRDARYKYIRNYMPHRPWAQHVSYMYEMPTMQAWQRLNDQGKLEGPPKRFFETKPYEELYDTEADPHEIANLAGKPELQPVLERMRAELDRWMLEIRDLGFLPEADLRTRFGGKPAYEVVRADPSSYPLERLMTAASLAAQRDAMNVPKLVALLSDGDPAARFWGATGLIALGEQALPALEPLRKALKDPAPNVRLAAAEAVAALGHPDEALAVALQDLQQGDDWTRHHAALVLDAIGPKAVPAVEELRRAASQDKNDYVKRVASHAVQELSR